MSYEDSKISAKNQNYKQKPDCSLTIFQIPYLSLVLYGVIFFYLCADF
jgi:hypothetical protein